MPLGRGDVETLGRFVALLDVWAVRHRLVGSREHRTLVTHHLVDSLAPARCLPQGSMVLDIGSGAGFPGIPLAVARPDLQLVLLDSRRLPISFMGDVVRSLGLSNVDIVEARVEDVARETDLTGRRFDVTIARAWARLPRLLQVSARILPTSGVAVAMKGPSVNEELAACGGAMRGFRLKDRIEYTLPDRRTPQRVLLVFEKLDLTTTRHC